MPVLHKIRALQALNDQQRLVLQHALSLLWVCNAPLLLHPLGTLERILLRQDALTQVLLAQMCRKAISCFCSPKSLLTLLAVLDPWRGDTGRKQRINDTKATWFARAVCQLLPTITSTGKGPLPRHFKGLLRVRPALPPLQILHHRRLRHPVPKVPGRLRRRSALWECCLEQCTPRKPERPAKCTSSLSDF